MQTISHCFAERRMLKQSQVFTFMQSQKVVFRYMTLFAQYQPSALSKVATCCLRKHVFVFFDDYLFCATNNCCLLASRTMPVSRASSCWWVSCSAQRCSRWWVSCSAQVLALVILFFAIKMSMRLSSVRDSTPHISASITFHTFSLLDSFPHCTVCL